MKQRIPDIKTVDMFFERLSDPKKVITHLAEMRQIRDEIREALELVDTKTKAEKLLRDASVTMVNAKEYESGVKALTEATASKLENDIAAHKDTVSKDSRKIADARKQLTADTSAFSGVKATAEKDIDARLSAVEMKEADLAAAEEKLAIDQAALNAWTEQMNTAKETLDRIVA